MNFSFRDLARRFYAAVLSRVTPVTGTAHPFDNDQDLTSSFAVLLEDCLRRTDRVESTLRDAERRFTSRIEDRSYVAFIQALNGANQGTRELLRQRRRRFQASKQSGLASSVYVALCGNATSIGDHLERHLPELLVERTDELEVFAVPLTRLAKAIVSNVELLFLPWYFDGYRAQVYDVNTAGDDLLRANLRRALGDDIKFVKLWHPATRQGDVFQHAVFAHELGHVAVNLKAKSEAIAALPRSGEGDWTYATLARATVPLPPGLNSGEEEQLVRWFIELACDVFAVRAIGPAFIIAFTEVTAHNQSLEPEDHVFDDHPPADLRYDVLAQEAARFDFVEQGEAVGEVLRRYLDSYPRTRTADSVIKGSRTYLLAAIDRFREVVGVLLGPEEFTPALLRADISLIFECASMDVPPAERLVCVEDPVPGQEPARDGEWSRGIDWRSILNGLLFWHLAEVGFPPLTEDDAQARQQSRSKAALLCTGAIELSDFQGRASYLREQVRGMRLPSSLELRR